VEASAETPSGFFHFPLDFFRFNGLFPVWVRDAYYWAMSFPDNILTDDESIIRQFRPHWRMLAIPVLWVIAAIVAIFVVFQVIDAEGWVATALVALILIALIPLAVNPLIKWFFTIYVLTSERLITRTGMIARSGIELPLQNINNVLFNQSVIERVLKSGDLLIESAGESGQSEFTNIPNPEEFQSLLYRTREEQSRKTAAEESAIAADITRDPTEQLERAARLRQEGVLSDEEFEEMKRKILGDTQ
jgi:uncharacterized membrane protein YdbT with pleckstrin-like domain